MINISSNNLLGLDVECSMKPIMHPWQAESFLSSIAVASDEIKQSWLMHHSELPTYPQYQVLEEVQDLIDKCDYIVIHNAKFDVNWLRHLGLRVSNKKIICTQVAEYLIRKQQKGIGYSLNDCLNRYKLPVKLDKVASFWDAGVNTDKVPSDILLPYNEFDAELHLRLWKEQRKLIKKLGLEKLAELSFRVTGILSQMELAGFNLDKDQAERIYSEYTDKMEEISEKIQNLSGFNLNVKSPTQLSAALYGGIVKDKVKVKKEKILKSGRIKEYEVWGTQETYIPGLGITPIAGSESKKDGYFSSSKDTLKALTLKTPEQREFINYLLEKSNVQKVVQTFRSETGKGVGLLDVVGEDGRVHPQFNQCITATGRLSSSKPNGQNLPRAGTSPVKTVVQSRNGRILNADLGQIEWRMAAELSRDPVAISEILNGIDAHADNAIRFFDAGKYARDSAEFKKLRTDAKIFLFRMIYGGTAAGFYRDQKMPDFSMEKWTEIVEKFRQKYSRLVEWQEENKELVLKEGSLLNFSGRLLSFPKQIKYDGSYGPSDKAICNYPVQSISADLIYIAMVEIMERLERLGIKSELILQVHDSMVFDAFEDEIDTISNVCMDVFNSLPSMCKELFDREFAVPTTGDIEVGLTYGTIVPYTIFSRDGDRLLVKFEDESKEYKAWVCSIDEVLKKHPNAQNIILIDQL